MKNKDKDYIIENNLRKYRVFEDITQKQLAEKLDISCAQIRNIETKKHCPKYPIRAKICKFFNVSQNQMFYKAESE